MRIFSLVSFWALVGAIAIYLLQLPPIPGIFLMMLGGMLWPGVLLHVCLIAFFVEAWTRRVPRFLAAVPLLIYGSYYVLYVQEGIELRARNAELRNTNPGQIMAFDPARFSLVDAYAGRLVQSYRIPSAYSAQPSLPEGYFVHFMNPRSACDIPRDSQARVRMGYIGRRDWRSPWTRCDISFPQQPPLPRIEIARSPSSQRNRTGEDVRQVTELRVDGVVKARFTTLYTSRLPAFPMVLAGCYLNDAANAWSCFRQLSRTRVALDGQTIRPAYTDEEAPERIMLGLRRYTDQELDNFRGYPENADLTASATGMARTVQQSVFETLEKALTDEETPLPNNIGYSLALEPERLTPHAQAMADRFDALVRDDADTILKCAQAARPDMPADAFKGGAGWAHAVKYAGKEQSFWACWKARPKHPGRGALLHALASGLATLPAKDFAPLAPRLWDTLHQTGAEGEYLPGNHPLLYIRSGDTGPDAAAVLKDDYRANRFRPYQQIIFTLAMCRAGAADAETIAMLKIDLPMHASRRAARPWR